MKRKPVYRVLSMLMAVVVAFGMLCISAIETNAESSWYVSVPEVLWTGSTRSEGGFIGVWKENKSALVTSVKSSDTKIVKVVKERWENEKGKKQNYFRLEPKSPGKAKVAVYYTLPNGTKKKSTRNVTVKKYPNHIKSLTVNGKKVSISKNKFEYVKGKINTSKVKIDLQLKKGWKIDNAWGNCWNMNGGKALEIRNGKSLLKNGKAISFPKKYSEFEMMITMTNGTDFIDYHVRLSRTANP